MSVSSLVAAHKRYNRAVEWRLVSGQDAEDVHHPEFCHNIYRDVRFEALVGRNMFFFMDAAVSFVAKSFEAPSEKLICLDQVYSWFECAV